MVMNLNAWDLGGNRTTSPRRAVDSSYYVVHLLKTLHQIEQCGQLVPQERDEADLPLETSQPEFAPPVRIDRWVIKPRDGETR